MEGKKEGKATITVKAKTGNAKDSITVYCVRKLSGVESTYIKGPIAWTCTSPSLFHIQAFHFYVKPFLKTPKLEIKGVYGSYFYVEFERGDKKYEGFIPDYWIPENVASDEIFRQISVYDLDVFVNLRKDTYRVTTTYNGNVEWKVSDTDIISFDSVTGEVIGKSPGIATITATVGDKTLTCTVHSIYRWPLDWTGAALKETYVYKAKGNTYEETSTQLAVGDTFTVKGDMGNRDGWAYGVSASGKWGYIPISHISIKNTISYYNSLGWGYPLENLEYNYINSPHAPRPDPTLNDEHRGIDINEKDNQDDIEGQKIVAVFDGVVKKVGADLNKENGCGYYICITSDTVDPVTGKKLIAIYQHMKSWALFSQNETVKKGDVIGYVGSTGKSGGSHLHFEVNNWNAGIGDSGRSDFTHTINPIYFYMNMVKNEELILNMDCSAVNGGFSFYYYSYDQKKSEE